MTAPCSRSSPTRRSRVGSTSGRFRRRGAHSPRASISPSKRRRPTAPCSRSRTSGSRRRPTSARSPPGPSDRATADRRVSQLAGSPEPEFPPADRRSRLLGGFSLREEGAKGVLLATVSTLVVLGLLFLAATRSAYWPQFKDQFLNRQVFVETFPDILRAFKRNIFYFVTAEPVILVFALVLAIFRSSRGPVFFPLRLMATIYVDLFRGIPTVLVVYALGFGMPALQIPGLPVSGWFWGWFGLILSYSAYVA